MLCVLLPGFLIFESLEVVDSALIGDYEASVYGVVLLIL